MAGRAVATWTAELKPSERTNYKLHAQADLKISNAALDPVLADTKGRSTVILHIDDDNLDSDSEEYDSDVSPVKSNKTKKLVLTSLTPGKIESSIHDIIIASPAHVTFEVIGENTIHLSGYLFVSPGDDDDSEGQMGMGFSDEESSDYEVALGDRGDFDSDEIMDDSHRFEEIQDDELEVEKEPKWAKKRPRESDEDGSDALGQKSKKKLKAEKAAKAAVEPKPTKPKDVEENPLGSSKKQAAPKPKEVVKNDLEAVGSKTKDTAENGAKPPKKTKEEVKKQKESPKLDEKQQPLTELPGGLKVCDKVKGKGSTAKTGSTVKLRYIAKLLKVDKNGNVAGDGDVFDSNTKGKPFMMKVGSGDVIKGFDQAIIGMLEGGERLVYIPPALGYGKRGSGSAVPPNSHLRFEIRLLGVL